MARNRKRAKERRARRPQSVAASRARREQSATSPISHGTPDVDLAEAQLEVGRPDAVDQPDERQDSLNGAEDRSAHTDGSEELLDGADGEGRELVDEDGAPEELIDEVEPEEEEEYDEVDSEDLPAETEDGRARRGAAGRRSAGGRELAATGAAVPERRWVGGRFLNFLQGSWRELQRVQWPDRRQVVQATGVVIGFVIVAGAFLGGADWVAGKVVTFILK